MTLGELRRLAQGHRTERAERLKARIKTELVMQQESSYSRSSSIARDWYHINRARTLDELERIIDGLSLREHQRLSGPEPAAGHLRS